MTNQYFIFNLLISRNPIRKISDWSFSKNLQGSKDKSTLVEDEFKMLQKLGSKKNDGVDWWTTGLGFKAKLPGLSKVVIVYCWQ